MRRVDRSRIAICAAVAMLVGVAEPARAQFFEPSPSTLELAIGGLPGIPLSALPGTEPMVSLSDGSQGDSSVGHNTLALSRVWSTVNFGPGTALFTGVPLISNLKVTVANQAGLLQDRAFALSTKSPFGNGPIGPIFGGVFRL